MAKLYLMVGLPGSGKTTLAKQLEDDERALRLTPDEWLAALSIDPYDQGQRAKVESLQWSVAKRAIELGLDVVLDFGFWSRRERDDFRARATRLGAAAEVRFLEVTLDELRSRLGGRRASQGRAEVLVTEA